MASTALPAVLRSRLALAAKGIGAVEQSAALPIHQLGATYTMAQEMEWLDATHFAIGRWDGSLSVFDWNGSGGPLITDAASDPESEGVQMITLIGPDRMVSSAGEASLAVWTAPDGDWRSLALVAYPYDTALGAANSGLCVNLPAGPQLIVGHASGFVSRWSVDVQGGALEMQSTLDLRNPTPVNPWGLHNIRGIQPYGGRFAITGSEDGYVCVLDLVTWAIRSQTVYNAAAQRGINSVAVSPSGDVLVANCAVGPSDSNLWYFVLDPNVLPRLADHVNLRIDASAAQVFNFSTIWGRSSAGPCFFASTEDGALWMGTTTGGKLDVAGYTPLSNPLGSALGYAPGGQLVVVSHDVYEFATGGA